MKLSLVISSVQDRFYEKFSFWYFSREKSIHKLVSSIQVGQNTYESIKNSINPPFIKSS
jgi:hypothetical protein